MCELVCIGGLLLCGGSLMTAHCEERNSPLVMLRLINTVQSPLHALRAAKRPPSAWQVYFMSDSWRLKLLWRIVMMSRHSVSKWYAGNYQWVRRLTRRIIALRRVNIWCLQQRVVRVNVCEDQQRATTHSSSKSVNISYQFWLIRKDLSCKKI